MPRRRRVIQSSDEEDDPRSLPRRMTRSTRSTRTTLAVPADAPQDGAPPRVGTRRSGRITRAVLSDEDADVMLNGDASDGSDPMLEESSSPHDSSDEDYGEHRSKSKGKPIVRPGKDPAQRVLAFGGSGSLALSGTPVPPALSPGGARLQRKTPRAPAFSTPWNNTPVPPRLTPITSFFSKSPGGGGALATPLGGGVSKRTAAARRVLRPKRSRVPMAQLLSDDEDEFEDDDGDDGDDGDEDGESHGSTGDDADEVDSMDEMALSSDEEEEEEEAPDNVTALLELLPLPGKKRSTEKLLTSRVGEKNLTEYLVKFKNMSYAKCEWVESVELSKDRFDLARVRRYQQRVARPVEPTEEDVIPNDFVTIDRIVAHVEGKYLVKWRSLPYGECTWESSEEINEMGGQDELDSFRRRQLIPPMTALERRERPPPSSFVPLQESPVFKHGHELRDYQLEGLNWLVHCWYERRNSILADEMGLGKTVQTVSVIHHLHTAQRIYGPFLIIVPLSTVQHWKREFEGWTEMNALVYHGNAAARQVMRLTEFYHRDTRIPKFNVLITTYEIIIADASLLSSFHWRYMAIDEAHRLKNNKCRLIETLRRFTADHMVLLTGTPLQNNTLELWSLLNFMAPHLFSDENDFCNRFGDLRDVAQVASLHKLLKPYLLRRMKEHVEKSIAPKEETVVEVVMTSVQKQWYRGIYDRNFSFLRNGAKNVPNMRNVLMQLRKCCNHPYLINGAEDEIAGGEAGKRAYKESMELLIKSSGKLLLVDKLLPKLRDGGNKVLIFSQMVRMLDILEDYMLYRGFEYERIDGGIRGNDRQAAIDRFCRPDSDSFVFMASTRAGGVGINLTAANTVIIFDSDWNPQNDIQAQARCHRIGQTQLVKIYRLITRGTYEKYMFDQASKKLGLDQAVLQPLKGRSGGDDVEGINSMGKREIDALLKFGAYSAYMDDDEKEDYSEHDIDQILKRSQTIVTGGECSESTGDPMSRALGKFSQATFCAGDGGVAVDDPHFWDKINPGAPETVPNEFLIEEPRRRMPVNRFTMDVAASEDDSDEDFVSVSSTQRVYRWKHNERSRVKACLLLFGFGRWNMIHKQAQVAEHWNPQHVKALCITIVSKCCAHAGCTLEEAMPLIDCSSFDTDPWQASAQTHTDDGGTADGATSESADAVNVESTAAADACGESLAAVDESSGVACPENYDEEPVVNDSRFLLYLSRHHNRILKRLELLRMLAKQVVELREESSTFEIPSDRMAKYVAPAEWWTADDDRDILMGSFEHGLGSFDRVRSDPQLGFLRVKDPTSPADESKDQGSAKETVEEADDGMDDEDDDEDNDEPKDSGASADPGWEKWPADYLLNRRIRQLLRVLEQQEQRQLRQRELEEEKRERAQRRQRIREEKLQKKAEADAEWSKREALDLYRLLIAFGMPMVGDRSYRATGKPPAALEEFEQEDWTLLKERAKLSKKSEEMIAAFYKEFSTACKQAVQVECAIKKAKLGVEGSDSAQQSLDDLKAEVSKPSPIGLRLEVDKEVKLLVNDSSEFSITQCKRVVDREALFERIRTLVLKRSDPLTVLKGCKVPASFPLWWKAGTHDMGLLIGLLKHGFAQWRKMCNDEQLPFYAVVQDRLKQQQSLQPKPADAESEQLAESVDSMEVDEELSSSTGEAATVKVESLIRFPRERKLVARMEQLLKWAAQPNGTSNGAALHATAKKEKTSNDDMDCSGDEGVAVSVSSSSAKKSKKYFDVPRDENGGVKVPFIVGPTTVHSLGTVVPDNDSFHSKSYIWPLGFKSSRTFKSLLNPKKKCTYYCTIEEEDGKPLFCVAPEESPDEVCSGPTPTAAWVSVLKKLHRREEELSGSGKRRLMSISGPEYFGFACGTVHKLVQDLPNADLCAKYHPKVFDCEGPLPLAGCGGKQRTVTSMLQGVGTKRKGDAGRKAPGSKRRKPSPKSSAEDTNKSATFLSSYFSTGTE